MDANGDGIGDFPGLMRRLDYLHGLGITAIWLMPFQPSPDRDDGYDISDYYGVNSRYGTLGDFVEFTHGAEQRGIRVIMDLVVNHTSDQHPRLLMNLLTEDQSRAGEDGKHHLLLDAYGYRWYRVGGLDYLLKRSEIETPKAR